MRKVVFYMAFCGPRRDDISNCIVLFDADFIEMQWQAGTGTGL